MNKLLNLSLALALAPAIGSAAPPLVDSTGVTKSVVPTIVMPAPGLTEKNVKTIIENRDFDGGGSGNSIPPGYKEVQVAMAPRSLGTGDGTYGVTYYTGLGYGVVAKSTTSADPCAGNLTSPPRVTVGGGGEYCSGGDGTMCTPVPLDYFVCEPYGTRFSLEKVIGGQTVNVTRPMLDMKTIYPALGMASQAATGYCQSIGYLNYLPGTIYETQAGDCNQKITRWNGSIFYNDSACYNNILQSMQCYK